MSYRRYTLHKPYFLRWRAIILISLLLGSASAAAVGTLPAWAEAPAAASLQRGSLLINEVKSGDTIDDQAVIDEYVSLYNATDGVINLSGITIEYAKSAFPAGACNASSWKLANSKYVNSLALSGDLAAHSISPAFAIPINNSGAGAVRVIDANGLAFDLAGWGDDKSPAPCAESVQTTMLAAGKSLQRYVGCIQSKPIDTDVNADDFVLANQPTPGTSSYTPAPQCTTSEPNPDIPGQTPGPSQPVPADATACQMVIISEVLPNPAGTDTAHEFVELHNTGASVANLKGCTLDTASDHFALDDMTLQPGEYRALSDNQTGLTLPNASGGTVWLANTAQDLQIITYPGDMEDDQSWVLADGTWSTSYTVTPGSANVLAAAKPCPADQIRNSETNRCVALASAVAAMDKPSASAATSTPAPCAPGQVRNPGTNRCRAAVSATTTPACKAGQERNPDTNRCRSTTASASTSPSDCPAGQERNPETKRCRKVSAAASLGGTGVQDASSEPAAQNKPYWLIAAILLVAAIAYAIYEWRQEIVLLWQRRFKRVQATAAATR